MRTETEKKGGNKGKSAAPRGTPLCSVPVRHFFCHLLTWATRPRNSWLVVQVVERRWRLHSGPRACRCYRNRTYVRRFPPQIPRHAVMCCCLTLHPALLVKIEQVSGHSYFIGNSRPPTTVTTAVVPRPRIGFFNFFLIRTFFGLEAGGGTEQGGLLGMKNSQAACGRVHKPRVLS